MVPGFYGLFGDIQLNELIGGEGDGHGGVGDVGLAYFLALEVGYGDIGGGEGEGDGCLGFLAADFVDAGEVVVACVCEG